ncbi:MAG: methyltransferase domain-containing protein [Neptuniibacter sp.]
MGEIKSQLDLDSIINNVSKEAETLDVAESGTSEPINLLKPMDHLKPKAVCGQSFQFKAHYNLSEFLEYQDKEFVANAFKGILGRDADGTGLDIYLSYLRNGGDRKYVIADLMFSDEGRGKQVSVSSSSLFFFLYKLSKKLGTSGKGLRVLLQRINHLFEQKFRSTQGVSKLSQIERNLLNSQSQLIEHLESTIAELQKQLDRFDERIEQNSTQGQNVGEELALVRQDLRYQQRSSELLLESVQNTTPEKVEQVASDNKAHELDAYYVAFEDACRGTREAIREAQQVYLPYLGEASSYEKPQLIDIGCGRGEWLQLMSDHGWQVSGVDLNEVMVQQCKASGFDAVCSDALTYLKSLPDSSVGLVTGFHIIEHLPFEVLFNVFAEAMRVLTPGGRILFETPNPENLLVASHTFYHDPTHRNPVTPTSVEFLAKYHGFFNTEIIRLHPYPEDAKVRGIDPLTERVNGHLCGPQDYAILATKPEGSL